MAIIAVTKETRANETRVAATPETVKKLTAAGFSVVVQAGAGIAAAYPDADYAAAGATLVGGAAEAIKDADVLFKVRAPEAAEIAALKSGAIVAAALNPHQDKDTLNALAKAGPAPSPWSSSRASRGPRSWTCCPRRQISPAIAP